MVFLSDFLFPDCLDDWVLALSHHPLLVLPVEDHGPGEATVNNVLQVVHGCRVGGGGQVGLQVAGIPRGQDQAIDDPHTNHEPTDSDIQSKPLIPKMYLGCGQKSPKLVDLLKYNECPP